MLKVVVNLQIQKMKRFLADSKTEHFQLKRNCNKIMTSEKNYRCSAVQQTRDYKTHFTNCNSACHFLSLMHLLGPNYKSLHRATFQNTSCRYLPWFPSWWSWSRSCHLLSCVYQFLEAVKMISFTILITNYIRKVFLTSVVLESSKSGWGIFLGCFTSKTNL